MYSVKINKYNVQNIFYVVYLSVKNVSWLFGDETYVECFEPKYLPKLYILQKQ